MSPSLGSRLPAHAVSMERVLLAGLDDAALDAYLSKAVLKKMTALTIVDRDLLRGGDTPRAQPGLRVDQWRTGRFNLRTCGTDTQCGRRDCGGGQYQSADRHLYGGERL